MSDWMILELPGVLLLYGAGLACCLMEKAWKATKGLLIFVSGAAVLIATALLILNGGSLWEAAAWLTVFLLLMTHDLADL